MSVVRLSAEHTRQWPVDGRRDRDEAAEAAPGRRLQEPREGRITRLRPVRRAQYVTRLTLQRWMY